MIARISYVLEVVEATNLTAQSKNKVFGKLETSQTDVSRAFSAVASAVHVRNRARVRINVDGKAASPYEIITGKRPSLKHLQEFGAPVFVKTSLEQRAHGKLQ